MLKTNVLVSNTSSSTKSTIVKFSFRHGCTIAKIKQKNFIDDISIATTIWKRKNEDTWNVDSVYINGKSVLRDEDKPVVEKAIWCVEEAARKCPEALIYAEIDFWKKEETKTTEQIGKLRKTVKMVVENKEKAERKLLHVSQI